jgi:peptidyl-prolyl cis-trans isomerase A (cyclophilin A)
MRIGRRATIAGLGLMSARACGQTMQSGAIPVIPVRLVTALGVIELILYIGKAPKSCADFLKYVEAGLYDGGAFTRTVRPDNDHGSPKIDVVQGGIRAGAKHWPPIKLESTRETGLRHLDGTISLPRDGAGTGSGSEFFICIGDQPSLDFGGARNKDGQGFAAFGHVSAGMKIVHRIWRLDASGPSKDAYTRGQMLLYPVAITSAQRG